MAGTGAALAACGLAAVAFWQNTPSFRSSVELVALRCAAVNQQGAPVNDLARGDFRVTDNGSPRIVEHLWLDTGEPLTLGVLIDASDSQDGQFAEHRRTVLNILQRLLKPGDRSFVIVVQEHVRLLADLETGGAGESFGEPCAKRPTRIPGARPVSSCGASPLWNAVYDATRLKLRPLTGNKALLILTDGFDSGSTHTWRQAVDEAHKAEASVYAIQYASQFGGKFAPELYRLVQETGGATFDAPTGDAQAIVSRLEADLRGRYVLGFRPEAVSGRIRHDVQVQVTRPGVTVRARKVYFRGPE
jgi:VWFA-related protein